MKDHRQILKDLTHLHQHLANARRCIEEGRPDEVMGNLGLAINMVIASESREKAAIRKEEKPKGG